MKCPSDLTLTPDGVSPEAQASLLLGAKIGCRRQTLTRNEVLDPYLFESIEQVQALTDEWLTIYNHERPHESLGRVPPLMFMLRQTSGDSSYQVST